MNNRRNKEEYSFLSNNRSRWKEFIYVIKSSLQFFKGFRTLHFVGPCITIFGSARMGPETTYYKNTKSVSAKLSKMGFTIITGGGPGLMQAANEGAQEGIGLSLGCNIELPKEQSPNPYLDKFVNIKYFFVRKELLRKYSCAFIAFPGGIGTLDELFETITLVQTKKMEPLPIAIYGKEFYKSIIQHFEKMSQEGMISPEDTNFFLFTDDEDELINHIISNVPQSTIDNIRSKNPSWLIGERVLKKSQLTNE